MGGQELTILVAHTRAREAGADSRELWGRPTCTGRLSGAAAAGRRRHFLLVELLVAESWRTIGADADVASPSRGGGDGAGERIELRGRRQRSPNSAALTVGRGLCPLMRGPTKSWDGTRSVGSAAAPAIFFLAYGSGGAVALRGHRGRHPVSTPA
jgi:hypothetical protein